jgi:hypothetical protein
MGVRFIGSFDARPAGFLIGCHSTNRSMAVEAPVRIRRFSISYLAWRRLPRPIQLFWTAFVFAIRSDVARCAATKRLLLVAASLLFPVSFLLNNALGQSRTIERNFIGNSADAINVGVFTSMRDNCTPAPLPAIRLIVAPLHGQIVVRRTRLLATNIRECLASELPAFVAYYSSATDYVGEDAFTLEIIGGKEQQHLEHITVTVTANSAQGI